MTTSDDLKERIEAIETGYEFMLAYAAQGRQTDKGAAAGRNVREYLDKMVAALDGLPGVVAACQLPPAVGAWALAIVGLFNIVGSFAVGWAVGRWRASP